MNFTSIISAVGENLPNIVKAAAGNTQTYFSNVENSFENAINTAIPFVWIAVAAALLGIGLMCIVGSDRSKEMAKSKFAGVIIGCALVVGSVYIAKGIAGIFTISGGNP